MFIDDIYSQHIIPQHFFQQIGSHSAAGNLQQFVLRHLTARFREKIFFCLSFTFFMRFWLSNFNDSYPKAKNLSKSVFIPQKIAEKITGTCIGLESCFFPCFSFQIFMKQMKHNKIWTSLVWLLLHTTTLGCV
jgi:hypothetical protein